MKIHPAAEENLRELGLDAEDEALLVHVFGGDDEPPQDRLLVSDEERDDFDAWRYGDGLGERLGDAFDEGFEGVLH